jgi:hypothetical protein
MEINLETTKLKQIGILAGILIVFYILASTGNSVFNKDTYDSNKEIIWPFCDFIYLSDNPFRDPRYYPDQTPNTITFQGIFYGFDFTDLLLNFIIGVFIILEANKYLSKKDYLITICTFLAILIISLIPEALNHREGFWPITLFKDNFSGVLDGFSSTEFSVYTFITITIIYFIKKSNSHGNQENN